MEGFRFFWTLPLFAALGAAGIYLQLSRTANNSVASERLPGIGISLAALAGVAAYLSQLPLNGPESGGTFVSITILLLLGSAAAIGVGAIVVCGTSRVAIRALAALCAVVGVLLAFESTWIVAAVMFFNAVLLTMLTLRNSVTNIRSENASEANALEPFLSCFAGGLFLLTMLTTICSAAITSGHLVVSDAAQVVKQADSSEVDAMPVAGRAAVLEGTGAIVVLCVIAGVRFRNRVSSADNGSRYCQ